MGIILDESAYTTITIFFGKVIDESKKDIIIKLINELNGLHNVEKFVLNRNDELLVQVPYVALSQDFNGDIVIDLLRDLLVILVKKEYIKFQDILGDSMMIDFENND